MNRGFIIVDCPTVDLRSIQQSTITQIVSDNSTVYNSWLSGNFTMRISINKLKIIIEWHGADSRHLILINLYFILTVWTFCLIDFLTAEILLICKRRITMIIGSKYFLSSQNNKLLMQIGNLIKTLHIKMGYIEWNWDYLERWHNHCLYF